MLSPGDFAPHPEPHQYCKSHDQRHQAHRSSRINVGVSHIYGVMSGLVVNEQAKDRDEAGGEERHHRKNAGYQQAMEETHVSKRDAEDFGGVRNRSGDRIVIGHKSCRRAAVLAARFSLEYFFMVEAAQVPLLSAAQVTQEAHVQQSANGICYAAYGDTQIAPEDLERIVQAVPSTVANALTRRAYYFVPLTLGEEDTTTIASGYTVDLADRAICHRNAKLGSSECIFISTRIMQDRFALAFEYFINVGHHFVEAVGVPASFSDLVWSQAKADVRGETSQDAYENRRRALDRELNREQVDEKAKSSYFEAAFSDAVAIYMLALTLDFDYTELKEREYPLLAASALAERLRNVATLFPPNSGYEFEIRYRRRG